MEGKTILIVDDEPVMLRIIQKRLSSKNKVLAAGSGKEALTLLKTQKPDLIILDHMMPDMKGLDLCIEIKKNPLTKAIPIIFFTSYRTYGFDSECERAGALRVVDKEEFTDLIQAVSEL